VQKKNTFVYVKLKEMCVQKRQNRGNQEDIKAGERRKGMKTALRRNEGHKVKVREREGDKDKSGNVNEKPLRGLVVRDQRVWKIHVCGSSNLQVVGFLELTHLVQDHNIYIYIYMYILYICKCYIYIYIYRIVAVIIEKRELL
jgi:hypothetical protein